MKHQPNFGRVFMPLRLQVNALSLENAKLNEGTA